MMRRFDRWLMAAMLCGVSVLAGCASKGGIPGGTPTAPITPTAKAAFAYTGNQGASLSGYSVNTSTGALTPLTGFSVNIGANPTVVAVDPQNRFLFVGDIAFSELHVFTIDTLTGTLAEIGTSPYATVFEPVAIAVDPSGTHLYVASQGSNSVGGFSLSTTGALTPIAGSPFATSGTQGFGDDIVINAAGTILYVQDLSNIYAYGMSAGSGALTLLQTIAGPTIGGAIALDPHGTYLYAVGSGTNSTQAYAVNPSTGLLTLAPSSPLVEQDGAYTISVSPTGQFAYTIEKSNYLVSYGLANGIFTPTGSVYSQIFGEKIGIDPSGSFVYVPEACSNCPNNVYNVVYEFSIGSTGALTKISASPVAAGKTPWGIAFTTQQ
jgi:6-phosphogluconolactonase (cycloisomerase 2 family)